MKTTYLGLAGIVAALALLIGGADRLSAHEEFHFTGTIAKVEPAEGALCMLTVTFKWDPGDSEELQTHVFVLNGTEVTRGDEPVPVSELEAGQHVVIDALGDDYAFTDAYAVRIVPRTADAQGATSMGGSKPDAE